MTRVSYMNDSSQLYRLLVSTDTRRVFPVLLYLPATPTHHYLPPSFTYQSFFLFIILLSHLIHYDSKSLSKTWKHFEIEIQNTNLQFRIYILLKKPSWSSSDKFLYDIPFCFYDIISFFYDISMEYLIINYWAHLKKSYLRKRAIDCQ